MNSFFISKFFLLSSSSICAQKTWSLWHPRLFGNGEKINKMDYQYLINQDRLGICTCVSHVECPFKNIVLVFRQSYLVCVYVGEGGWAG